jgi:hypothetical protein
MRLEELKDEPEHKQLELPLKVPEQNDPPSDDWDQMRFEDEGGRVDEVEKA